MPRSKADVSTLPLIGVEEFTQTGERERTMNAIAFATHTIDDLIPLIKTGDRFEAWLKSKKGSERVGRARNPFACPIKRWLEFEGFKGVGVLSDTISLGHHKPKSVTPPFWVERFVREIDVNTPVWFGLKLFARVTAKDSLAALA